MAGFKGHLIFGIAAATGYAGCLFMFTDTEIMHIRAVFFLTSFSAILPDIDSHSGIPAQIVFSALSLATIVLLFDHYQINHHIALSELILSIILGLSVYPLLSFIFKKTTIHRGAFHSIPMAFILGLITASIVSTHLPLRVTLILSTSVTLGYLCHLLLDELVSLYVKSSFYLKPKKSFGTALKLTANSSKATAVMYSILCYLSFANKALIKYTFKLLI